MKSKDLPEELVEFIVGEHLEQGWEYTYWGKKITLEYVNTKKALEEIVAQELNADDYDVPVNVKRKCIQWPCTHPSTYYACIYMDKHDGDSCGVIVLHESIVKEKMNKHIKELKDLLGMSDEN